MDDLSKMIDETTPEQMAGDPILRQAFTVFSPCQ